jgi:transketolase
MNFNKIAKNIRKDVLAMAYNAHLGHIAPSLSIVDILTVLYFGYLNIQSLNDSARDRFILSKGHAVSALYATLYRKGWITKKDLMTYCTDGGLFSTHPLYDVSRGVELTTGSLGHGLGVGAGMALGLQNNTNLHIYTSTNLQMSKKVQSAKFKMQNSPKVVVLLSDAEMDAGSTWEAVMFAGYHKISNLIAVVDVNGLQAFGKTKDVIDLEPIDTKWREFGWETIVVDGHDHAALLRAFSRKHKKPLVVFARTIGGKGVTFMQNTVDWHYWPMSEEQYERALKEINIK